MFQEVIILQVQQIQEIALPAQLQPIVAAAEVVQALQVTVVEAEAAVHHRTVAVHQLTAAEVLPQAAVLLIQVVAVRAAVVAQVVVHEVQVAREALVEEDKFVINKILQVKNHICIIV